MFAIQCISYRDGDTIPTQFVHSSVRGGENISPGFRWSDPPSGTKSFALSIIDPHPVAKNWVHWFVIDIPSYVTILPEGISGTNAIPRGSKELQNTSGGDGYDGPSPPPGSGAHPYVATIYALSISALPLSVKTTRERFFQAIKGHVLAEATMTGYYER